MTANLVYALALAALALACVLFASIGLAALARMRRSGHTLDQALERRAVSAAAQASAAAATPGAPGAPGAARAPGTPNGAAVRPAKPAGLNGLLDAAGRASLHWLDTPLGALVVAPEDRRLLDRCGFVDVNARARFFGARVSSAVLLPVALVLAAGPHMGGGREMLWVFAALIAGFMLPKWLVARVANARQRSVIEELPMFVDLLRLLQGVGLSLDQSLQVMINDFPAVLPVLAKELALAHRQFTSGRTREQSLQRLSTSYENDDLSAVVRLVIQVDKHGGAVQEPLRQFGDRLRESRRAMLRERIGKLTVKMTGVMVVTLLPALLIVTAGPGFLAVMHSLAVIQPHRAMP